MKVSELIAAFDENMRLLKKNEGILSLRGVRRMRITSRVLSGSMRLSSP